MKDGPDVAAVVAELRRRGLRSTPQRRAIVAEILGSNGHIDPRELIERVKARIDGVNPSTVYRTLSLLDEIGVLRHAHLEYGVEYHRAEHAAHAHLTCSNCGRTESVEVADLKGLVDGIKKKTGFTLDPTHFAMAGTCSRCS